MDFGALLLCVLFLLLGLPLLYVGWLHLSGRGQLPIPDPGAVDVLADPLVLPAVWDGHQPQASRLRSGRWDDVGRGLERGPDLSVKPD